MIKPNHSDARIHPVLHQKINVKNQSQLVLMDRKIALAVFVPQIVFRMVDAVQDYFSVLMANALIHKMNV